MTSPPPGRNVVLIGPKRRRTVGVPVEFEAEVRKVLQDVGDMLVEKNAAYGNSALDPVRIFSSADPVAQIDVRIDDKLSRIERGNDYNDEDTVQDLIGYLVLRTIAKGE